MKIRYISVEGPGIYDLKEQEYDPATLGADEVLMETAYSAVSAGTERAWMTGNSNNPNQKYPHGIGYSASGIVLKTGKDVKNLKEGDRVLVNALGHISHGVEKAEKVYKITDDRMDLQSAAFTFISSFPLLGVRRLRLEMGESVMVAGLACWACLLSGSPFFPEPPRYLRRIWTRQDVPKHWNLGRIKYLTPPPPLMWKTYWKRPAVPAWMQWWKSPGSQLL